MGREPVTGIDEPPHLDDGDASSSDGDLSVEDHGISEGDVDKDDPNGEGYELAGALHEFYHAFHVVSNLNDISAYPVATQRMKAKAKAKQQDELTKPEDSSPNDFLNDPDDTPSTGNGATEPSEVPSTIQDKPTDHQAVGESNTPLHDTSLPEVKEKKELQAIQASFSPCSR
jgi:hypothetical protein